MRICIDYRPALHESTGVGTYVKGLLQGLLTRYPEDDYTAFSASWRHRPEPSSRLAGVRFVDARIPVRLLDMLWNRRGWPAVERWVGSQDVVHSPSPMPIPSRSGLRVVTVHDCYFLRHPEQVTGPMRRDYVPLLRRAISQAHAVITNTETTRRELLEHVSVDPELLRVTPLGVDSAFLRRPLGDAPVDARVPERYLLFVGRREPRKDPTTLLAGFDRVLADDPAQRLVLVGPDGLHWDQTWAATTERVRVRTLRLPHQPADRLARLYAGATALLLPSRWEGFGLTAIEAMAAGTPVVATRAGALPEVLGDAASWIEVGDADGLAHASLQLSRDTDLRQRMVAAGLQRSKRYRWEATAQATHELYRQLLA